LARNCDLDDVLGLNRPISRRDFLDGMLLTSLGSLAAAACPFPVAAQRAKGMGTTWTGYTGEGDYNESAGNTEEVVRAGHAVRDGGYDRLQVDAIETGEVYDCVVVGGGFAGLSAGLFFQQRTEAKRNCLILDNARIFGGVAKRNEFIVDGHRLYAPQGSVHFQPPYPNSFLEGIYETIGLDWGAFKSYQTWGGSSPRISLPRTPYAPGEVGGKPALGFFFGAKYGQNPGLWITDPWGKNLEGTAFPNKLREELLTLSSGKPVQPRLISDYPGDDASRQLDSMTLEDYIVRTYGVSREAIRLLYTHEEAGGSGLGPDALSAYVMQDSRQTASIDDSYETGIQMFPGGNSGIIRLIVKTLIPNSIGGPRTMEHVWKNPVDFASLDRPHEPVRIRLASTVVRVEHLGEPSKSDFVSIIYVKEGQLCRVKAKSVVMAGGGWITKHVVRDLDHTRRKSYDQFIYAPYLVANVAVRNWRFLYKLGISKAVWFEGFGNSVSVRKSATFGVDSPAVGPDLPAVLTFFVDFAKPGLPPLTQGQLGRTELLTTSFIDYERQIREQMTEMFGPVGFDAKRDIAGIILNRFGHPFVVAQPGFFFGSEGKPPFRDALRNGPFGRIAFSHSDLAGVMDHREAFDESQRAIGQILNGVLI
jgi:spermidine dehydrogenase